MEKLYKLKPEIAESIKDKMPKLASIEQPLIWWANLTAAPVEDLVEARQDESYKCAEVITQSIADWSATKFAIYNTCGDMSKHKTIDKVIEEIADKYEIKLKD